MAKMKIKKNKEMQACVYIRFNRADAFESNITKGEINNGQDNHSAAGD